MYSRRPLMVSLTLVFLSAMSAAFAGGWFRGCAMESAASIASAPVKKIIVHGVGFDLNKPRIQPGAVPVLNEAVQRLQDAGGVIVIVPKPPGITLSQAFNRTLEQRRAKALQQYLVAHGIAAGRITMARVGEPRPPATNAAAEGGIETSRVELCVD